MNTLSEIRIERIRRYFREVDAQSPALLALFTDDVEFFFPKFGVARGKAALVQFAERIAQEAAQLTHDIDGLIFTVAGDRIAVEGREAGVTADGRAWPDGVVSQGRFANVFEFDGELIQRVFIYVDPDFTNDDQRRVALYRDGVSRASPRAVTEQYLAHVGAFWAAPDEPATLAAILDLFADTVDWDIPGHLDAVPWIGPRRSRADIAAFYQALAARIQPERFAVQRLLADHDTAVVLGELASRVQATGQLIETPFAIVITVQDGKIVRYRMLEDSHAVAVATLGG